MSAQPMPFKIRAFQEALAIVSDFNTLKQVFCELGGWTEIQRGLVSPSLLAAWQLPTDTVATECLLANPGIDSGYLRLLRFENLPQSVMRANDQSWETGGTFDFNVRLASMQQLQPLLSKLGWRGVSDPVEFILGESRVIEWIAVCQQHLRFAFIERVSPALTGWTHMQPLSQIFNSSQIVRDLTASLHFYQQVLGFQCIVRSGNLTAAPGPNVLGLPYQRAHTEPYELVILQPDGEMRGSIELVHFRESTGRHHTNHQPPHLGMLGVRFPVQNITQLAIQLSRHQILVPVPLTEVELAPYGRVWLLAAQTPDGAWLEFFEPINALASSTMEL